MTIEEVVDKRGIGEVLHFTTNEGLLGILLKKSLKSRKRLPEDNQLEYIFRPNANYRKDEEWLDYVNLSISRINHQFFNVASKNWHKSRDIWWCILSFNPVILLHEGVYFCTTNNMYTDVQRSTGAKGLESLFNKRITQYESKCIGRDTMLPPHYTTCPQAEVLYPGEISTTEFLNRVYVNNAEAHDDICGHIAGVGHPEIEININSEIFEG